MAKLNLSLDTKDRIRTELKKRMTQSPDLPSIRKTTNQIPVFVYGSLKQGFPNHEYFLSEAVYLGKARTVRSDFKMYSAGLGYYPVVLHHTDKGSYIFGEVYVVTPDMLMDLDSLESNGYMYTREKCPIVLTDQEVGNEQVKKNPIIHCFTYIGNPDVMMPKCVDSIKPQVINNQPEGYHWEKIKIYG